MMFAHAAESDGLDPGALRQTADQMLEGELVLARDDSYRIRLTDRDGLTSAADTEYFLRVMNDRPPDVRILRPANDQQITPLEEVAIEARAEDDYGISRFELVYIVAGREPKVIPFAKAGGSDLVEIGDAHARSRGPGRTAGRRDHLLRSCARHRPRQAIDRGEERHVLPRGAAVCRGIRAGAEPGHVGHGKRTDRNVDCGAERNHQRDVEHRAPGGIWCRPVERRRQLDCGRAVRVARASGADGEPHRPRPGCDSLSATVRARSSARCCPAAVGPRGVCDCGDDAGHRSTRRAADCGGVAARDGRASGAAAGAS